MDFKKFLPLTGLIIFLSLIFAIGPQNILNAFFEANPVLLLVAFLFFFPIIFIQAFKWGLLLRYHGINLPFFDLLKIFLIGSFFATVTPGKLGSFIRIPYLKKKCNKSLLDCSINVLTDRLMDVFSLFFIAAAGIVFFPFILQLNLLSPVILFFVFLFMLFFLFLLKKNLSTVILLMYRFLPQKFRQKNTGIKPGLLKLGNWSFLKLLFLSVTAQFLVMLHAYIIAVAFGISIPLQIFISIMAFSSIIVLIPISIQGIGTREAVLIYFFSFFSVDPSKTIVFSVSTLVLLYLFNIVFGGYLSVKEPL